MESRFEGSHDASRDASIDSVVMRNVIELLSSNAIRKQFSMLFTMRILSKFFKSTFFSPLWKHTIISWLKNEDIIVCFHRSMFLLVNTSTIFLIFFVSFMVIKHVRSFLLWKVLSSIFHYSAMFFNGFLSMKLYFPNHSILEFNLIISMFFQSQIK